MADNAKKAPQIVTSYHEVKYGVDILDQMAKKYTCRNGTKRWQIHSFLNIRLGCYQCLDSLPRDYKREHFSQRIYPHIEPKVQKRNGVSGEASFAISNEDERQQKNLSSKDFVQEKSLCWHVHTTHKVFIWNLLCNSIGCLKKVHCKVK